MLLVAAAGNGMPGDGGAVDGAAVRRQLDAGHWPEALGSARELLAREEAEHGKDSSAAMEASFLLVESLVQAGRAATPEAGRLADELVDSLEASRGPAHPDVARALELLAATRQAREPREARRLLERSLELRQAVLGPEHLDVAQSCHRLGALLLELGEWRAAKPYVERALRLRDGQLGAEHPDTLRSSYLAGRAATQEGDVVACDAILTRASDGAERVLGPDHPELAAMLAELARCRHDRTSAALAERAFGIATRALGPDHPVTVACLHARATSMQDGCRPVDSRADFERAVAAAERVHGPDSVRLAQLLLAQAYWLNEADERPAANRAAARALDIARRAAGEGSPLMGDVLSLQSVLRLAEGDLAGAKVAIDQALALRESQDDPRAVAGALNRRAIVMAALGDKEQARADAERAIALVESRFGPEHPWLANPMMHLAGNSDPRVGLTLMPRAIALAERRLGPDHCRLAPMLTVYAGLLLSQKDYAAARPLYERARAIDERTDGPEAAHLGFVLTGLCELETLTGEYRTARADCERAIAIRERVYGPDHPRAIKGRRAASALFMAQGDLDRAIELSLEAARGAVNHFQTIRYALTEDDALSYTRVVAMPHQALSAMAGLTAPERESWLAPLLDAVVRARALVLDEMAVRHRDVLANPAPELRRLLEQLRDQSSTLARRLSRGTGMQDESAQDLIAEIEATKRELASRSEPFRAMQARGQEGLADVLRAAPPRSAMVSYVRYDRITPGQDSAPAYAAFVSGPSLPPRLVDLGPAERVDALVAAWLATMGAGKDREPPSDEVTARLAGDALRRAVWDPVAGMVEGSELAFVVPDGELQLVSFAALPTAGDRYLIETGPTIHLLSAERDLAPPPGRAGSGLLLVGNAEFDRTPAEASAAVATVLEGEPGRAELSTYRGALADCGSFRTLTFEPLPRSGLEVADIERLWGGLAGPVRKLTGAAAGERALKQLAPGSRVIHLATHGFFLGDACRAGSATRDARELVADHPLLFSGLALAGANRCGEAQPNDEDGILTAEEIASIDLTSVEWVVLSACDSGRGSVRSGEGVFGLRRAFQIAGARTLIMSLWPVMDGDARQWMKRLYEARVAGAPTATAVRRAGSELLEARRQRGLSTHPRHWGAFVAAGDWR